MLRKLNLVIVFVSIFLLAGCTNDNSISKDSKQIPAEKLYQDNKKNISFNYPDSWQLFDENGSIILIKKPLQLNDLRAGKFGKNDCSFSYEVLINPQNKSLDDFFKNQKSIGHIKLGTNDFMILSSKDITTNTEMKSYALTINGKIFDFVGINNDGLCKEEFEKILASIKSI